MKKTLSVALSLIITTGMVLSGCGKADNEAQNSKNNGKGEKVTLKILAPQIAQVVDLKTNEFTKYLEETANVSITWETIPEDAIDEKVNIILSSGDYPDAILGCGLRDSMISKYGESEKILMPLNDLIEKSAPNYKEVLKNHPELQGMSTSTDGKIYALPSWNDCYHCSYAQKMWINQSWLDKLNLKAPTTTDELYNVLKAFKEKDPNGNGKADEIALTGNVDSWHSDPSCFIMDAFILDPGINELTKRVLNVKEDKIDTIANKPEYREGLRYLNKLYKEGLLDKGAFTQKIAQVKQYATNPDAEVLGSVAAGYNGMFIDASSSPDRYKHYTALAPIQGPQGVRQSTFFKYSAAQLGSFAITKSCKNPEAAMRVADAFYSFEGSRRALHGRPDQEWRKANEGEVGIDGKPAVFKEIRAYSEEPQNFCFLNTGITYNPKEYRLGSVMDPKIDMYSADGLEKLLYEETDKKYAPYTSKDLEVIPPIKLLSEENDKVSTLNVELSKYITESRVRFITGDMSLDKDWDKYVSNLDKMGLKEYLSIYQKGYERQYKKTK